ncbi:hypothetical protein VP01_1793g4 [Puccinia sorghi]|uniref:t-SNARE coiled-coil homology domain-containing protein n=1 Tax=Puccinia sorghi TaxID=27349 RepID=A0A0L6VEJ9_9BASI|nr:hypothetical protein VP01_1793g4 [Puccinia sorghi]
MSFNDLERGLNERAPLARDTLPGGQIISQPLICNSFPTRKYPEPTVDREFQNLANKVSTHIFRMNSNVSGLQKLIDLLGSSRDTSDIRRKLHDLTESTREFIKNSSSDAKKLASWQVSDSSKIEQQKVSRDYASSIQAFQRVSRLSVERQKQFVDRVKSSNVVSSSSNHGRLASQDLEPESHELSETRPQLQQQLQIQQQLQESSQGQADEQEVIPNYELDYQEALIEERENEIREIEVGITELNQIFRDLGTIVQEQGGNIDNIESNVHRINNDMSGAVTELHQAHEYQKKSGKKMLCLLIIFAIVLSLILIAVSLLLSNPSMTTHWKELSQDYTELCWLAALFLSVSIAQRLLGYLEAQCCMCLSREREAPTAVMTDLGCTLERFCVHGEAGGGGTLSDLSGNRIVWRAPSKAATGVDM